jgi:uncharacterized protein
MHFDASSLIGLAVLLLVGLVVAIVLMTGYTIRVLTHPPRRTYATALARGRPGDPGELDPGPRGKARWTQWTFRWRGLDLPVWDIEGDKPEGPTIILSHGWGDSRIGGLTRTPALAAFTSRLILWDMPGHGEAKGVCSLGAREVDALLSLIERVGAPVVLYGWSLGAVVSIAAAARSGKENRGGEPGYTLAVIAEAPYSLPIVPARNVMRSWGLPWWGTLHAALWFLGIRFGVGPRWKRCRWHERAAGMTQRLLVLHGERDEVCPLGDGLLVSAMALRGATYPVPGAGHHGLWTTPEFAEQCREQVEREMAKIAGEALNSADAQQPHG